MSQYIPHKPTEKQHAALLLQNSEVLYGGAGGGGKALSLDTPIPTTDGWKTMGEVRVGDVLFDENGEACNVLAISDIMHDKRVYDVHFSDGSVIRACGEHRWKTMSDQEREQTRRRNSEFRTRRRATRPSTGTGKRPDVAAKNAVAEYTLLDAPNGSVRTTEEIQATLYYRGAVNHAIALAKPLLLPVVDMQIDPYILGFWLGDGTSASGQITTADSELLTYFREQGYTVNKMTSPYGYNVHSLVGQLRTIGVLKNKHIPSLYLRSSFEQRLALLQGLMDTDGTALPNGQCEFYTTNRRLADDAHELIVSLGIKATIGVGRATLYGKDCGEKYRIKFKSEHPVFRLERKLARQKPPKKGSTAHQRYIVDVVEVETEPVKCIAVSSSSHLFLAGRSFIPTHNSDWLLMAAVMYVDVPGYAALLLRRTFADLAQPGALMDRAMTWWGHTDAHWNEKTKTWTFPSGAKVVFGYMQYERDRINYQSSEYQFIGFDEVTQFTERMYTFLFSRRRKPKDPENPLSHVPLRTRTATNPGGIGAQWVYDRFVNPDYRARILSRGRYFIPAKIEDNPHLDQEEYLASLGETDAETQAAMIDGKWLFTIDGVKFQREWFLKNRYSPSERPHMTKTIRVWDLAGTKPHEGNVDPDWTRGLLYGLDSNRNYHLLDLVGIRDTPGNVEKLVRKTAENDGSSTKVYIQQDPGQAGKSQIYHYQHSVLDGFRCIGQPTGNKSKEDRADPVSGAAERGKIFMEKGAWNSDLLDETELFPHNGAHDDIVDVLADGYNILSQRKSAKHQANGARALISNG